MKEKGRDDRQENYRHGQHDPALNAQSRVRHTKCMTTSTSLTGIHYTIMELLCQEKSLCETHKSLFKGLCVWGCGI